MIGLVTKAGVTEEVFATGFEGSSDIHLPLVFNAVFLRNFSPSIVLYLWTSLMCIAPTFFWKGIYIPQGDQENQSFIRLIVCQGSAGGEI